MKKLEDLGYKDKVYVIEWIKPLQCCEMELRLFEAEYQAPSISPPPRNGNYEIGTDKGYFPASQCFATLKDALTAISLAYSPASERVNISQMPKIKFSKKEKVVLNDWDDLPIDMIQDMAASIVEWFREEFIKALNFDLKSAYSILSDTIRLFCHFERALKKRLMEADRQIWEASKGKEPTKNNKKRESK